MCDVKLQNPFQKQEISINEEHPSKKISIAYQDPTTFENVILNSFSLTKSFWSGKVSFETIGDICDFGDYIEFNGILKIEKYKSGPLETKGGIVQFKRLYFHFRDLEIPVTIKYYYDKEKICNEDIIQNNSSPISLGLTFHLSHHNSDTYYYKRIDTSNNQIVNDKSGLNVRINTTPETSVKLSKYFVTNLDNENNMNPLMNNLEPKFRQYDSSFNPFYQAIASSIVDVSLGRKVEKELNRIICSSQTPSEEIVKNSYVLFNEKVNHLRELNLYSLIRKNYS